MPFFKVTFVIVSLLYMENMLLTIIHIEQVFADVKFK
jgi:hypothetical protein